MKLEVDVDDLGDNGIGLDQAISERLEPHITKADFELAGEGDDAAMTLRVRFRVLESGDYDYGIHFEFIDGQSQEPAIEWVDCHMCVDARLMPVLDERTPALVAALDARAAELEREAAETSEPVDEGPSGEGSPEEGAPDAGPAPKPLTGLGIGGIVLAGLGAGGLIWGGVELSRGVVVEESRNNLRERVDHRPAGYTLIAVGSTALVTGAVLLAVDLSRQSKKRKQARERQAHFYPVLTPDGAGLGVSGKF
ncbi:hypothetical protein [Pseudenhygromyxa sp. WMMC2535]|uniref:hypothetical protein n=1 Tax=Pseudenhygromyxa sp. WMMC2535 TaxID=2712867 RepID=UPI001556C5F2|nr:hypothetical protein [Pseudenhygromyxa sp. WMMC2535]